MTNETKLAFLVRIPRTISRLFLPACGLGAVARLVSCLLHAIDPDAAMRRGGNARLVRAICEWPRGACVFARFDGGAFPCGASGFCIACAGFVRP